jgi:plasmid stabilization system protein ParE
VAARITRSGPAADDLDSIWDYLAAEASPAVADFVLARLFEAMSRAAENPHLYPERFEYRGRPRRINVFEYAIFYEPLPEGDGIFVWRVLHGRRRLAPLVKRPPR